MTDGADKSSLIKYHLIAILELATSVLFIFLSGLVFVMIASSNSSACVV